MSLKPAIGTNWIKKYKNDLTHGYIVTDGKKMRVPRNYKQYLMDTDPLFAEYFSHQAQQFPRPQDNLEAAEEIHHRYKQLHNTHHI